MSCQCPRSDHDRRFVAGHAGRAIHALRDQATAVLAEAGLGVHWQDCKRIEGISAPPSSELLSSDCCQSWTSIVARHPGSFKAHPKFMRILRNRYVQYMIVLLKRYGKDGWVVKVMLDLEFVGSVLTNETRASSSLMLTMISDTF